MKKGEKWTPEMRERMKHRGGYRRKEEDKSLFSELPSARGNLTLTAEDHKRIRDYLIKNNLFLPREDYREFQMGKRTNLDRDGKNIRELEEAAPNQFEKKTMPAVASSYRGQGGALYPKQLCEDCGMGLTAGRYCFDCRMDMRSKQIRRGQLANGQPRTSERIDTCRRCHAPYTDAEEVDWSHDDLCPRCRKFPDEDFPEKPRLWDMISEEEWADLMDMFGQDNLDD